MRLPILILHISAGLVGLLSGAAAMIFLKGSRRHRTAGNVFVISMLTMATAGAFLGFMKHQTNNIFGGLLTIYLVGTAWKAGRPMGNNGKTDIFDWLGFLFAFAIGALSVAHGVEKASGRIGLDGVPAGMDIFLGSVILLAAAGDFRMLVRRGISGTRRVARHLWRMCFGLFIASGSFFLGQGNKVFPDWVLRTNVLFIPAILPLLLLIFWIFRVRFSRAYSTRVIGSMQA
jgi:uncharacterized membrane protein